MILLPILAILFLALVFLPGWYVKHVMHKYSAPNPRFPGTGGELARHLLDRFGLPAVGVELTENGDHYDPRDKMVRLSKSNYEDKSLTAIAVAAHEVGHALQDKDQYPPMQARTRMVNLAGTAEKIGSGLMLAWPVITLISRSPISGGIVALAGMLSLLSVTLVHIVTLPVEFNASFGRALPILEQGEYINRKEHRAVKRILRAAALTYVAASLSSLLNLGRWISVLRR
jgi:Zn-dependent membrane protease YugP